MTGSKLSKNTNEAIYKQNLSEKKDNKLLKYGDPSVDFKTQKHKKS